MLVMLALNSRSSCLSLLNAGITHVNHHAPSDVMINPKEICKQSNGVPYKKRLTFLSHIITSSFLISIVYKFNNNYINVVARVVCVCVCVTRDTRKTFRFLEQ
jgi:hypothetical protein